MSVFCGWGRRFRRIGEACPDKIEDRLAALPLFGRGAEYRRELLPTLQQRAAVACDVRFGLVRGELVAFGEDDPERNAVFAEQAHEIEVDLLWFEARIDQHEEEIHLLALEDVVEDQLRELFALPFRDARVTVAGQVDQVPAAVDQEMVDQPCFAGSGRDFGQRRRVGQQVDKRRLADVRTADKGELPAVVCGALRELLAAAAEDGGGDVHTGDGFIKGSPQR